MASKWMSSYLCQEVCMNFNAIWRPIIALTSWPAGSQVNFIYIFFYWLFKEPPLNLIEFPARLTDWFFKDLEQDVLRQLRLDGFIIFFQKSFCLVCPYLINETPWSLKVKSKENPPGPNLLLGIIRALWIFAELNHFWVARSHFLSYKSGEKWRG